MDSQRFLLASGNVVVVSPSVMRIDEPDGQLVREFDLARLTTIRRDGTTVYATVAGEALTLPATSLSEAGGLEDALQKAQPSTGRVWGMPRWLVITLGAFGFLVVIGLINNAIDAARDDDKRPTPAAVAGVANTPAGSGAQSAATVLSPTPAAPSPTVEATVTPPAATATAAEFVLTGEVVIGKWSARRGDTSTSTQILGEVINQTNVDVIGVHIEVRIFDAGGALLGEQTTCLRANRINVGGMSGFTCHIGAVRPDQVADADISVEVIPLVPGESRADIYTAAFEIFDVVQGQEEITGRIRNIGDPAAPFVSVSALFYDEGGTPYRYMIGHTEIPGLLSGEETPFRVTIPSWEDPPASFHIWAHSSAET